MKKIVGDTTDSGVASEEQPAADQQQADLPPPVPAEKSSKARDKPKAKNMTFDLTATAAMPVTKPTGPLVLQGAHLAQLFRLKPELTEYLYLEIQNMKLDDLSHQRIAH